MRLFGRNLKQQIIHVEDPYQDEDEQDQPVVETPEQGPYDLSEKDVSKGYVDFGSLKLPVHSGMNVQLEISEKTRQLLSISVVIGQSSLQLQAFSAPKTIGIWEDIKEQLETSLAKQNAEITHKDGRWGSELLAQVPAKLPDGRTGHRIARFAGVDGSRWFLRAVFAGQAALGGTEGETMEDFLSHVVVDRGDAPMAPRELLPLKAPAQMVKKPAGEEAQGEQTPEA